MELTVDEQFAVKVVTAFQQADRSPSTEDIQILTHLTKRIDVTKPMFNGNMSFNEVMKQYPEYTNTTMIPTFPKRLSPADNLPVEDLRSFTKESKDSKLRAQSTFTKNSEALIKEFLDSYKCSKKQLPHHLNEFVKTKCKKITSKLTIEAHGFIIIVEPEELSFRIKHDKNVYDFGSSLRYKDGVFVYKRYHDGEIVFSELLDGVTDHIQKHIRVLNEEEAASFLWNLINTGNFFNGLIHHFVDTPGSMWYYDENDRILYHLGTRTNDGLIKVVTYPNGHDTGLCIISEYDHKVRMLYNDDKQKQINFVTKYLSLKEVSGEDKAFLVYHVGKNHFRHCYTIGDVLWRLDDDDKTVYMLEKDKPKICGLDNSRYVSIISNSNGEFMPHLILAKYQCDSTTVVCQYSNNFGVIEDMNKSAHPTTDIILMEKYLSNESNSPTDNVGFFTEHRIWVKCYGSYYELETTPQVETDKRKTVYISPNSYPVVNRYDFNGKLIVTDSEIIQHLQTHTYEENIEYLIIMINTDVIFKGRDHVFVVKDHISNPQNTHMIWVVRNEGMKIKLFAMNNDEADRTYQNISEVEKYNQLIISLENCIYTHVNLTAQQAKKIIIGMDNESVKDLFKETQFQDTYLELEDKTWYVNDQNCWCFKNETMTEHKFLVTDIKYFDLSENPKWCWSSETQSFHELLYSSCDAMTKEYILLCVGIVFPDTKLLQLDGIEDLRVAYVRKNTYLYYFGVPCSINLAMSRDMEGFLLPDDINVAFLKKLARQYKGTSSVVPKQYVLHV